ncbi:MAG: hypothetical protein ABRQ38_21465, partial [Candidatus Eremiobacterota bacterium]
MDNMGGIGNIGGQLDAGYMKSDTSFKKGIHKAKSVRNRRAKRKVRPHIPKMEASHQQTNQKLGEGRKQGHSAQDKFMGNQYAKDAMSGGKGMLGLMPKNMGALAMMGGQQMGKGGSMANTAYQAPVQVMAGMGNMEYGSMTQIDPLTSALSRVGGFQQQIGVGLQTCFTDGRMQMNMNQMFSKNMLQHTKMGQMFGMKEQMFGLKEKMFNGIGQTLNNVGTALNTAATGVNAAATGVEAAASAVAAVPYVGPALSAALKVVAKMLKMIAKLLQNVAKQMQNMGKTMTQKGQLMGQQKNMMNMKKMMENKLAEMFKGQLKVGQERMGNIQNAMGNLQQQQGLCRAHQNAIMKRLEELGANPADVRGNMMQNMGNFLGIGQQQGMGKNMMGAGMLGAAMGLGAMAGVAMNNMMRPNMAMNMGINMGMPSMPATGGGFGGGSFAGAGFGGGGFGGGFGGGSFSGGGPSMSMPSMSMPS